MLPKYRWYVVALAFLLCGGEATTWWWWALLGVCVILFIVMEVLDLRNDTEAEEAARAERAKRVIVIVDGGTHQIHQ